MGGPCTIDGKKVKVTDNFAQMPMVVDGVEWVSCEQYYQAQKFLDKKYIEVIRAERDGMRQWMLGQSRKYKTVTNWEEVKVDTMYHANKMKFEQHPDAAAELSATKGPIKPGGDPFWAKWNAVLLTRIREEVRLPGERDEAVLAAATQQMEAYRKHPKK
eukprot:TRINITY_DN1000_c2_g1_i1.p1 TRINITY_DN1000_c2_g1~~TRINITY_DN1000_c2_g1_i1.p1  ORF type:complete len:159 (+),score=59.95 TRINITY_DN1000_c2_g1_i1:78-554(+)